MVVTQLVDMVSSHDCKDYHPHCIPLYTCIPALPPCGSCIHVLECNHSRWVGARVARVLSFLVTTTEALYQPSNWITGVWWLTHVTIEKQAHSCAWILTHMHTSMHFHLFLSNYRWCSLRFNPLPCRHYTTYMYANCHLYVCDRFGHMYIYRYMFIICKYMFCLWVKTASLTFLSTLVQKVPLTSSHQLPADHVYCRHFRDIV